MLGSGIRMMTLFLCSVLRRVHRILNGLSNDFMAFVRRRALIIVLMLSTCAVRAAGISAMSEVQMQKYKVFGRLPEVNILSLGGGRQSTALALMVLNDEMPVPDAILFADTGAEREDTLENVARLHAMFEKKGIPLVTVSDGNIIENLLNFKVSLPVFINASRDMSIEDLRKQFLNDIKKAFHKRQRSVKNFPMLFSDEGSLESVLAKADVEFQKRVDAGAVVPIWKEMKTVQLKRACTHRHKILPIRHWCLENFEFSQEKPLGLWLGISLDEWTRMATSEAADTVLLYPLIERRLTSEECINFIKKCGYAVPVRSACFFCPYHSDKTWQEMTDAEIEQAASIEAQYNKNIKSGKHADKPYFVNGARFHRSMKPISEKPFLKNVEMPAGEQDGACGQAGCFL